MVSFAAMIGMSGGNRGCAVKLFGEHDSDQHVGPGCGAEGNQHVCAPANRIGMAIGSTDQKTCGPHTAVSPVAEHSGKIGAGEAFAALVQNRHLLIVADPGKQRDTLGIAGFAARVDLVNVQRSEAERASHAVEPAHGNRRSGPLPGRA